MITHIAPIGQVLTTTNKLCYGTVRNRLLANASATMLLRSVVVIVSQPRINLRLCCSCLGWIFAKTFFLDGTVKALNMGIFIALSDTAVAQSNAFGC